MTQIRDLVKKYNLYLFSGEVYRDFIYTDSPCISAMHLEEIKQNVVLIDSVSKAIFRVRYTYRCVDYRERS